MRHLTETVDHVAINEANTTVWFDVRDWSTATVFAWAEGSGAWTVGQFTVYRSPDKVHYYALESAEALGPGDDATATLNVTGYGWLCVRLTTLEGAAEFVGIACSRKADP